MLQALTNKQTITALTETLEDAVTMGADQTELAEGIRKRLEEGRAWDDTAARFLAAPGRPPISALEVRSRSGPGRSSWLLQTSAAYRNWRPAAAAVAVLASAKVTSKGRGVVRVIAADTGLCRSWWTLAMSWA